MPCRPHPRLTGTFSPWSSDICTSRATPICTDSSTTPRTRRTPAAPLWATTFARCLRRRTKPSALSLRRAETRAIATAELTTTPRECTCACRRTVTTTPRSRSTRSSPSAPRRSSQSTLTPAAAAAATATAAATPQRRRVWRPNARRPPTTPPQMACACPPLASAAAASTRTTASLPRRRTGSTSRRISAFPRAPPVWSTCPQGARQPPGRTSAWRPAHGGSTASPWLRPTIR
mmetsp:Transcript_2694/g.6449  ORF Transcript_2694/g.6449 Transcript_2694/m.6449 type:complete len:233 (-) Transcript_2694:1550-2248(-)